MIRLAFRVAREDAEIVLAELIELAPAGVEERDLGDLIEYSVYGSPGELPEMPEVEALIGGKLVSVASEEIADDWADRWKQFHQPITISDKLHVRPPWADPHTDPTILELVVDPGRAFGTGAHATTRLCLEFLVELAQAGEKYGPILDLGCGSGVLGIAAAKLGWGPVHGLDFQPESVAATVENAEVNGVSMTAERFDLLREGPSQGAPLVFANLLRPLLLRVAADGFKGTQPDVLIASGLLETEATSVAEAFAKIGLVQHGIKVSGDWAALLLRRA